MWKKITSKVNEHAHMSQDGRGSERVQATAEIITPSDLVIEMLN